MTSWLVGIPFMAAILTLTLVALFVDVTVLTRGPAGYGMLNLLPRVFGVPTKHFESQL